MLFALTTLAAVTVFIHRRTTAVVAAFDKLIARCHRHGSYPSVPAGTDFRPLYYGMTVTTAVAVGFTAFV